MPSSTTLLLTGFPGWFGNRFLELLLTEGGSVFPFVTNWTRIIALVEPSQLEVARGFTQALRRREGAPEIELISLDIGNQEACDAVRLPIESCVLVHAAGIIHPRHPRDFLRVNTQGTQHVLDLAGRHGVERVVLVSSNSPCGGNPNANHRFTTTSPYTPYMGYGESKRRAEELTSYWSALYSIPVTILRPCWFFGPHQPLRQARFFEMILAGRVPMVAGGIYLRSITFVDDLCQGVLRALAQTTTGTHTYWIALEEPSSFKEIVTTIRDVLQSDFQLSSRSSHIPLPDIAASVARIGDAALQAVGLYHQELHVLGELGMHIACSVQKSKQELGFIPTPSLHEAVRRSLRWTMDHGQLKR
ncbi:NAD(P)-dependent oxidoreductase [Patescibacteria group bacterium]|nr:NAD(P)-dependent oxidoreductase [Patescibacteria group bacterium]MBP9709703.1 NAD(P)-dependent oxidoreductase [Patescibacteria group bacterium]